MTPAETAQLERGAPEDFLPPPPRPPVRRHPILGFSLVFGFMALTGLLAATRGASMVESVATIVPVRTPAADALPPEVQRALVTLGRQTRGFLCLETFDWDHPDSKCRDAVVPLTGRYAGVAFEEPLSRLDPESPWAQLVRNAHLLANAAPPIAIIEAAPGPAPANIELMIGDVARRARAIVEPIDAAFELDAPRWTEVPEPPPPPEPEVVVAPPPKVVTADLPALPSLLPPLEAAAKLLEGRERVHTLARVDEARRRLAELEEPYALLKAAPLDEPRRVVLRRIDTARGRLLRAADELARAARLAEVSTHDGLSADPWPPADEAVARALPEVQRARAAVDALPR